MRTAQSVTGWAALGLLLVCLVVAPAVTQAQPYQADVTRGNKTESPESMHDCNDANNPLVNCGFETGDFTGWVTQDLTDPFFPLQVDTAGVSPGFGFFSSAPTEGVFAALNGFDGNGPGTIIIAQDVTLPGGAAMEFDYRAAWDLASFGATQDRVFSVEVEPAGGGAALQTDVILIAQVGTINLDTGPLSAVVDLSAFGGQTVRVSFEWFVPEDFSGPAFAQLDNVLISPGVPAMPMPAYLALAMALALGGAALLRRRYRSGRQP